MEHGKILKHITYHNKVIKSIMLSASLFLLTGCGNHSSKQDNTSSSAESSSQVEKDSASSASSEQAAARQASNSSAVNYQHQQNKKARQQARKNQQKQQERAQQSGDDLANLNYQSGQSTIVNVNNDKSTLHPEDWKVNSVEYSNLDNLNRTSAGNTADLDKQNVANDSLRTSQTFKPTGYRQKFIHNEPIINRGHEIAYSLSKGINASGRYELQDQSGDQNNPKNLFTQTAFSNQKVQTIYESKVRNALRQGKRVVYQVKPIFANHDLMAKGVHMQAISTDKSLDYNVYLYNVQPGMNFDYTNGSSTVDHNMNVPTPAGAPNFKDDSNNAKSSNNKYTSYRTKSKHHYLRDAAIAGTAHHFVKRHYQEKYGGHTNHHFLGRAVVGGSIIHHYARKHY